MRDHIEAQFFRRKIQRSGEPRISKHSLTRPATTTAVTPRYFSDGVHYQGYIWDCLRSRARITIERFRREVVGHSEVLVMADDHSRDRVLRAPLWLCPPYSVARFESQHLLASLEALPEDIYVFDSSLSWTLLLTHEDDGRRRLCLAVGINESR